LRPPHKIEVKRAISSISDTFSGHPNTLLLNGKYNHLIIIGLLAGYLRLMKNLVISPTKSVLIIFGKVDITTMSYENNFREVNSEERLRNEG
jgi:hypothetical protein